MMVVFEIYGKFRAEFLFDENGNMIMEIWSLGRNNAWVEYEYMFDENGNLIMQISYDYWGNTWVEIRKDEFTLDDKGK